MADLPLKSLYNYPVFLRAMNFVKRATTIRIESLERMKRGRGHNEGELPKDRSIRDLISREFFIRIQNPWSHYNGKVAAQPVPISPSEIA
jgi:hypothetical protein